MSAKYVADQAVTWPLRGGPRLIEILLEPREHLSDQLRRAEVGHGIGEGVVIFEAQQRGQLVLVQFLRAHVDVVVEDEIDER